MLDEMAEVNKVFAIGDTYKFYIVQFSETKNTNLNMLIDFFDSFEDLMNSLANINAITEEDEDVDNDQ